MHGEIPGSFGRYGCVISHIFAGSFLEAVEDIYEGTVIPNRKFHSGIKPVLGTKMQKKINNNETVTSKFVQVAK